MGATKEDHGRQHAWFSDIPSRCCSGCPGANALPVPEQILRFFRYFIYKSTICFTPSDGVTEVGKKGRVFISSVHAIVTIVHDASTAIC